MLRRLGPDVAGQRRDARDAAPKEGPAISRGFRQSTPPLFRWFRNRFWRRQYARREPIRIDVASGEPRTTNTRAVARLPADRCRPAAAHGSAVLTVLTRSGGLPSPGRLRRDRDAAMAGCVS